MNLDNWYGWDFFILILITEESMINWLDLDKTGHLLPTGLVLTKRGVGDQLAWSWQKGRLLPTGLVLTNGASVINEHDHNERSVCDQHAWSWQKGVSTTNSHDLDKKRRLRPIGMVLIKGVSATNWLLGFMP